MEQIKHTPGPWEWVGRDIEGANCAGVMTVGVECGGFCQGGSPTVEISDSDARLIAAAPELLEALDWCIAEINRDSPAVINARAAVSKAIGA